MPAMLNGVLAVLLLALAMRCVFAREAFPAVLASA